MYRFLFLVSLSLFVTGCGPHTSTPTEAAAASDLIVLGEVRIENGQEKLFAIEILKGSLGSDIDFRLGAQITPTFGSLKNVAGSEGRVLLYYQKRFGAQCWLMMTTASGANAPLVEELRKKVKQMPVPTAASVRSTP